MKLIISVDPEIPYWNLPRDAARTLQEEFSDLQVVYLETPGDLQPVIRDADALCSYSIRAEEFRAAARLRWIHTTAAGVGSLLIPEVVDAPVVVTNSRGANSPAVAEHVMAGLLALARKLPQALRHQEQRLWNPGFFATSEPPLFELGAKTMGIIGLGSIGRAVARRAAVFGMRILATKRDPTLDSDLADWVGPPDELPYLLAESDVVVMAAPLTWSTGAILGRRELGLMKPGALLVNVARGRVVDEPALIEALREGRLGGAVLDVFAREPLSPSSPLWTLPNVLLTSHYAGLSPQLWTRALAILQENVARFRQGAPLLNIVDKQRGY